MFPQPLSLAATFKTEIAYKIGRITIETRAVGVPWNFYPVLDVGRQPIWPRLYETFGEDVYLVSKMGEAFVKGSLGDLNLMNKKKTIVCLKHFVGHSASLNGRVRMPAHIAENVLRDVYLPPFETAWSC